MDLDALVGRTIWDESVPTPFVYVDRAVLGRNIERMAGAARASGVNLRPHTKTHKLAEIAQLQLDAGAAGLTVAKLGEAQALVEAGVSTSFMVAQPYVGAEKVGWQLDLAETCEVIACVDSLDLARALAGVAAARGRALDLVLIVDTGYGRLGVLPGEAAGHAEAIAGLEGARFRGIRSHSGAAYVFFDRMQVSIGSASLEDCALTVVASVVSAPARGRAVIDAGVKALSATRDRRSEGHGLVLDRPDVSLVRLSEECGWIQSETQLRVGERLRVVPNHACELTNLAEVVLCGTGEAIEGVWRPVARGKVW